MLGNSATPKQDLAESAVFITSKYRYWLSLNASACNQIRLFYCSLRYSQPIKLSEMWSLLVAGCGLSKIDRRNHLTMRDWGSLNQQHLSIIEVFESSSKARFHTSQAPIIPLLQGSCRRNTINPSKASNPAIRSDKIATSI
jgi:hypothetical protein